MVQLRNYGAAWKEDEREKGSACSESTLEMLIQYAAFIVDSLMMLHCVGNTPDAQSPCRYTVLYGTWSSEDNLSRTCSRKVAQLNIFLSLLLAPNNQDSIDIWIDASRPTNNP